MPGGQKATHDELRSIAALPLRKILTVTNDRPQIIPVDVASLDFFDLILKREPYADRERYPIGARNRNKLLATMLACPVVNPRLSRAPNTLDIARYGHPTPAINPAIDAFFLGAANAPYRVALPAVLAEAGLQLSGGFTGGPMMQDVSPEWHAHRLSRRRFRTAARRARINFALGGFGPFTFRHLELWSLACFFMSSNEIEELETPIPFREGVHYVGFSDTDDFIDKCRHYAHAETDRLKIAQAGRVLFEERYSFIKHGEALRAAFDRL